MKSVFKSAKRPSAQMEALDLDVTPIMNMFVILIPFLVSMAVFTHYSVLEFSLPPSAGMSSGGPSKKDLKLTVVIRSGEFELTVGDSLLASVEYESSAPGGMGLTRLETSLSQIRQSLTKKEEVVVAVNDGIEFDTVVQVMDACKKTGYLKVALAEGPNNPEPQSKG